MRDMLYMGENEWGIGTIEAADRLRYGKEDC